MDLSSTLTLLFSGDRWQKEEPVSRRKKDAPGHHRGLTLIGVQAYKAWERTRQATRDVGNQITFEQFVPVETAVAERRRLNEMLSRAAIWSVRVDRRISSADKAGMRHLLQAHSLRPPPRDILHEETIRRISTRELAELATNQAEAGMLWLVARSTLADASINEQRFLAKLSRNLALPEAFVAELSGAADSMLPVFGETPETLVRPVPAV